VKVRVQARDGKILGPATTVKQPLLSVRDVRDHPSCRELR